jgi:adenosine deaminase
MNYQELPKTELHLHLDCSLSYKLVKRLRPETTYEEWVNSFVAPAKCTDLADYITRAIKGVELMQTTENIRLATLDVFEQLKNDRVIYAELRFAPLQHIAGGLSATAVVQAVNDAVKEGIEQFGVEARIILCTLRHYTEKQSLETVQLVKDFKGTLVAGFDIAADEAGFPIDNHITAFQVARANGIKCTAHAGEARGADSVWETLKNFYPLRIGHGVRSAEDDRLLEFLKKENIHLEVCPSSNIQVNVFDTIKQHSCNKIYNTGVSMSISTDARTITPVTLADEYQLLENTFDWGREHFLKCNLEAIAHAFIEEPLKQVLREKLLAGFEAADK